jgi:hypothetical protein
MRLHDFFSTLSLVGTLALLGACNGSGGGNTEDTSAGPTTMTASAGTTSATAGTGTGTGSSGSEPTTAGSVGQTDSTGATSSPVTTTSESTGANATSGGSTGVGSTGVGTDGTSGGDTTGGGEVMPCVTAKDCQLADGCCVCEPLNPGETAPPCDIPECIQTTCAAQNLLNAELECRWGVCAFAKLTCNPLGVVCKSLPPNCAPGDVPGVAGDCWSGTCIPAKACDWVPDCSYCAAPDLVCVLKGQKGAYHVCEPRPLDCPPGEIDCGCGQQICDASPPHTICNDATPGIECECPFC